jgi:hypothetical protein
VFTVPQESGNYSAKGVVTYTLPGTQANVASPSTLLKPMSSVSGLTTIPRLADFIHYNQSCDDWCGVTVAQMTSKWWNVTKTQDQIAGTMGLGDKAACKGTTPEIMVDNYYTISTAKGGLDKQGSKVYSQEGVLNFDTPRDEIEKHRPLNMGKTGHVRAIIGVKSENGKNYLWVDDPGYETTDEARSWIEYSKPTYFILVRE